MSTYNDVQTIGNQKVTTKYTCEQANLKYTIIGENIKEDFNFLINDLPNQLDEMLKNLNNAASIDNAFYLENSAKINDLMHIYDEISADTNNLKTGLAELYSAFLTDIDNVNAELANNFGYWAFSKPREASKEVEIIETPTEVSGN